MFAGVIPKNDRYKYFGNLRITYEGQKMDIIDMSNQDLVFTKHDTEVEGNLGI